MSEEEKKSDGGGEVAVHQAAVKNELIALMYGDA